MKWKVWLKRGHTSKSVFDQAKIAVASCRRTVRFRKRVGFVLGIMWACIGVAL